MEILISCLLSLLSFIGMALVYFLRMGFTKLSHIEQNQTDMLIEIEKLKLK